MKRIKSFFVFFIILVFCVSPSIADWRFSEDADAIEKAADSVFMIEVYSKNNQRIAVGSGFVAFDSSTLVTNYHVIEGGAYIVAISDDNEKYVLDQLCATDRQKDIAIFRSKDSVLAEPLPLDEDSSLKRSQTVVAIGSPAGLMNTVSIGNISAFYKKDGKDWIQFTAPISSGSSGGALLNDQGNVIGITTATYASTQNINMAVKAKYVISLYHSWDKKTTLGLDGKKGQNTSLVVDVPAAAQDTNHVYVTSTGKRYHNNPGCSGMHNPIEMDLLDAIEKGYEPCGKCYK